MAWFLADKDFQFYLRWQIAVFTLGLFVVCMFCHGELARRRPGPRHLTLFYLVVSLGGVIGGVLVGVVAPIVLPGYLELEIALVATAALALALRWGAWIPLRILLLAVLAFTSGALIWRVRYFYEDTVYIERNYYGVVRVKEVQSRDQDPTTRYRSLVHGAILHGEQYLSDKYRRSATTYYKASSGIGSTLLSYEGKPIRVGVIGLGAGSLAVYGNAGDVYRFYDIDPAVVDVAKKWFTYVADSPAKTEIVLGDARLSMEREAAAGLRRDRGRRLRRRRDPGAPHHHAGGDRIPAPPEARRRHRIPRLEPLPRPEARPARDRPGAEARIREPLRLRRDRGHDQRLGAAHAQQGVPAAAFASSR